MLNLNSPLPGARRRLSLSLLATFALLLSSLALAQTTISTGSVVGTVTDQQGAVVEGARVTVTNSATSQTLTVTSTRFQPRGSAA
jgi:hypothetical protein